MSKTYSEILANMKLNMGKKRPDLETTEGTIVSDEFEVIADELEDAYVDVEHQAGLGSFKYWATMSNQELDDLAYNYGKTRKPALKSSGTVYFRTATAPTTDILIPVGTIVTTELDTSLQKISFTSTSESIMYVANIASYYNATSGYYEIAVPVQCDTEGTTGNVGVGAIKLIEGSVTGIQNVYNYSAFTNAEDEETNEDFADRCLLSIRGVATGTEAAYIAKALENIYVYDALVVGPGDPLMLRDNGLGGKIDVYVKVDKNSTDVYTQTTDTIVWTSLISERIMPYQPIKSVVSVVGSTSGPRTENVHWKYTVDTGVYKGSVQSTGKVEFLTGFTDGETVVITYKYYSIVQTLVDEIETVRPITADVLTKLADDIAIDITAFITGDSTITDIATLKNTVKSTIEDYLTFKSLAGTVEQADIIQLVHNVTGVDNIRIPLDKLAKAGYSGVADVTIGKNEYSIYGTITISS